mgnify:FL=1
MDYNEILKTMTPEQMAVFAANIPKGVLFPKINNQRKPSQTLENYQALLDHYGVTIKYNEMSKETEILVPGYPTGGALYNNAIIAKLRDLCHQNDFIPTELDKYIEIVAEENKYHPVKDWIDAITW